MFDAHRIFVMTRCCAAAVMRPGIGKCSPILTFEINPK